jgi:hypothetical protein
MVLRNDVTVMFRDIFDNLNDISLKTEAVFFDHNGVSNPRMVIRLDDNYLIGCMLPKGFVLVQTRPNSPAPSPVELHHYLDINVGVQDAMVAAIKGAAEEVFEWLRAKMYLQPLKAKQDC